MPQRPPTLDEVLPHYIDGLTQAATRDLTELPALKAYASLGNELSVAGLPKPLVTKILPRIKIGVTENFIKHELYNEIMRKFALVIAQLHRAVASVFGEDGEELFLTMCEDRFALVLPV